nr:type I-E CRISPR-associated protein Cas5/CasD [Chloroflexia bacterium]
MPAHSLLLRLAGPMQSWGTQSRFTDRDTGREPSKSGVVGLLAAADGRRRWEAVDDLATLDMAVRVDREGLVHRDYQTVLGVLTADGSGTKTVVSDRYYLADAEFLVAVSGPNSALLERLSAALAAPTWPLRLGRAAFVPGVPVHLPDGGVRPDLDAVAALKAEPWHPLRVDKPVTRPTQLRAVLEVRPDAGTEQRLDQLWPGSTFADRRFISRHVTTEFWDL